MGRTDIVLRSEAKQDQLQIRIMKFVDEWVKTEKRPVPQKEIINRMKSEGVKSFTTVNAINALIRKGYIRKGIAVSNKTLYVQLKGIISVGISI